MEFGIDWYFFGASASQIRLHFYEKCKLFEIKNYLPSSFFVTDGGSNIVAALDELQMKRNGCLAHIFQLVIRDGLNHTPQIRQLLSGIQKIVSNIWSSSHAKFFFKNHGTRKLPNIKTWWNSDIMSVYRFVEFKDTSTQYFCKKFSSLFKPILIQCNFTNNSITREHVSKIIKSALDNFFNNQKNYQHRINFYFRISMKHDQWWWNS